MPRATVSAGPVVLSRTWPTTRTIVSAAWAGQSAPAPVAGLGLGRAWVENLASAAVSRGPRRPASRAGSLDWAGLPVARAPAGRHRAAARRPWSPSSGRSSSASTSSRAACRSAPGVLFGLVVGEVVVEVGPAPDGAGRLPCAGLRAPAGWCGRAGSPAGEGLEPIPGGAWLAAARRRRPPRPCVSSACGGPPSAS